MVSKDSNPILNKCNIYLFVWCLYLLQGSLYESGSVISQFLLIITLSMSLYHFVKIVRQSNKPIYFVGLDMLLFMFTIYGVILMITDGAKTNGLIMRPPTFFYLKNILISLLPIYSCYYYSKNGMLTKETLIRFIPLFLIVAIVQYDYYQRQELMNIVSGREDITNNSGYVFLSLIPCMYIFKNRLLQVSGIIVCLLFVLFSVKRGAILVAGVTMIVYVFQQMRNVSSNRKILFLLLMFFVGILLFQFLEDTLFQNDYFISRVEDTMEGDSSDRDHIYSDILGKYQSFNIHELVLGIGADGTLKISHSYAHNDWLEILVNQGFVGIIMFFVYWRFFYMTTQSNNLSQLSRDVLFVILIISFSKTLFSMSINNNTIFIDSIMGLALAGGLNKNDSSNKRNNMLEKEFLKKQV